VHPGTGRGLGDEQQAIGANTLMPVADSSGNIGEVADPGRLDPDR
jgi:hypothetical protein